MKKVMMLMLFVTVPALLGGAQNTAPNGENKTVRTENLVPDEQTAIAFAEAVLVPIHGREKVEAQKPFTVQSPSPEFWFVYGSTHGHQLGGGFLVIISKKNGCLKVGTAK